MKRSSFLKALGLAIAAPVAIAKVFEGIGTKKELPYDLKIARNIENEFQKNGKILRKPFPWENHSFVTKAQPIMDQLHIIKIKKEINKKNGFHNAQLDLLEKYYKNQIKQTQF